MADMITANFSANEIAWWCGCGIADTDPEFMRMLQELKDQMQGPLRICIGHRSEHHNDWVSTAKNKKNGVYNLDQASNILISGERAMLLFEKALQIGFIGIGLSQKFGTLNLNVSSISTCKNYIYIVPEPFLFLKYLCLCLLLFLCPKNTSKLGS